MSGEVMDNQQFFEVISTVTKNNALDIPSRELNLGIDWV